MLPSGLVPPDLQPRIDRSQAGRAKTFHRLERQRCFAEPSGAEARRLVGFNLRLVQLKAEEPAVNQGKNMLACDFLGKMISFISFALAIGDDSVCGRFGT